MIAHPPGKARQATTSTATTGDSSCRLLVFKEPNVSIHCLVGEGEQVTYSANASVWEVADDNYTLQFQVISPPP